MNMYCRSLTSSLAVLFLTACNNPQSSETADPTPIAIQQLTGTLEIDADGPPDAQGWLFINGELRGSVPLHKEFALTPGNYELRCVTFKDKSANDPNDPSYYDLHFYTVFGRVLVQLGKTTACKLELSRYRHPEDFEAAMSAFSEVEGFVVGNGQRDSTEQQLTKKWNELMSSDDWKPIASLAETWKFAPPTRRRVSIQLPDQLGGAREVDVAQMKALHKWLLRRYDRAIGKAPILPLTLSTSNSSFDEKARERALTEQRLLARQLDELRVRFDGTISNMIRVLEKAPGD